MSTLNPGSGSADLCLARIVRSLTIALITLLLLAGAWLAWLVREEIELGRALQAQQSPMQSARRIHETLDGLATGVQQLARDGNGNAQAALAELNKLGVVLSLNAGSRPAGATP